MQYRTYTNLTFKNSPYYKKLPPAQREEFDVLSQVFHFKVNNYVLEHLIDWQAVPNDPIYRLAFLRKDMLHPQNYAALRQWLQTGMGQYTLKKIVRAIERSMYPEVKKYEGKVARVNGVRVPGVDHLFHTSMHLFPDPMVKTCHAYCNYCFRWLLFTNKTAQQSLAYQNPETPVQYLKNNPQIVEVTFTGADPLVLKAATLKKYIEPILAIDSIQAIRICSKSLAWWPFRFTTDRDADELLQLFDYVQQQGKHLSLRAHFTHPRELAQPEVATATARIRATGTQIHCQGPLVQGINDTADALATMWTKQVQLGMVPYYLFMEADHSPQSPFRVPLARALRIFQEAQHKTTALARTVRGPVFMNDLNRVLLDGTTELNGQKYFVLKTLQCPPGTHSEGKIKLIPYNPHTTSAGNLFELFNEAPLAYT